MPVTSNFPPQCAAPGCTTLRHNNTRSPLCQKHRRAQTRYGHPLQAPVLLPELQPHLTTVRAYKRRNADSAAWTILAEAWAGVVGQAQRELQAKAAGRPYQRHTMHANEVLAKLGAEPFDKILELALAMFVLEYHRPGRFHGQNGFRVCLARRVMRLSSWAIGKTWNHREQRVTLHSRDFPAKVLVIVGTVLLQLFGLAGRTLAEQSAARELAKAQKEQEKRRRLVEAVESMR